MSWVSVEHTPVTVSLYVVVAVGEKACEPLAPTLVTTPVFRSVMVTADAFVVAQESVVDWPAVIVVGAAE